LIVAGLFVMLGLNTATNAVMIDINGEDGPTAAGWEAFNGKSFTSSAGPVTYLDAFGTGADLTLEVAFRDGTTSDPETNTRWKDDSFVSGTPTEMWQDWGGARNPDSADWVMTMDEGAYDFTVYFSSHGTTGIDFTLPDGSTPTVSGFSADDPLTLSGSFTVGAGDTGGTITLLNRDNQVTRVHGLEVTLVPEPASMALLGLGGLAALIRRRR
jgi:hypothetical protein